MGGEKPKPGMGSTADGHNKSWAGEWGFVRVEHLEGRKRGDLREQGQTMRGKSYICLDGKKGQKKRQINDKFYGRGI